MTDGKRTPRKLHPTLKIGSKTRWASELTLKLRIFLEKDKTHDFVPCWVTLHITPSTMNNDVSWSTKILRQDDLQQVGRMQIPADRSFQLNIWYGLRKSWGPLPSLVVPQSCPCPTLSLPLPIMSCGHALPAVDCVEVIQRRAGARSSAS